jgi:two-component system, sensor histidine kinase and response regulator
MKETLHLLVVDDELGMRLSIERALAPYTTGFDDIEVEVGFRVSTAESGEAALELAAKDPPQIILLDYKLPGMSGLEVLQALTDARSEALVVMITAYASLETAVQATKIGAFDFLAKPFTPIEVKAAVHKTAKHYMIQAQARKLAGERRQIRFEFLSVLAHELKSPLAAVEGNLRILRDHSVGEDIKAYDHLVARSVLRLEAMRKLILDLLDLTHIESGRRQRALAEVDLCASAVQSLETHQVLAQEKGVNLLFCPPGAVMLRADPAELEMMFNNLVSNAIKYNRDGGSVTVEVEEEAELVRVKVHDTGIGMTGEEMARLFGEFSRIKNEKTRNILGSGLGLSILKRLANLYGGRVEVESVPDQGSTFTVTLKRSA